MRINTPSVNHQSIDGEVVAVYGPEARPAVETFLHELATDGLTVDGRGAAPIIPLPLPASFSPPVFEKFMDLQDLLLLDPIHEVDEIGWPHQRT